MADPQDGKPPKSADAIRAKLELLKASSDQRLKQMPAIGEGFQSEHPLLIGTFHDRSLAIQLQRRLREDDIYSDLKKHRRQTMVTIDYSDSEKAVPIAEDFRRTYPDSVPLNSNRRIDGLFFGSAIGLTAGGCLAATFMTAEGIGLSLTFLAIGGLLGHSIDRKRTRKMAEGTFSMWDFLVFVAAIGLTIVMVQLTRRLI